MTPASKSQLRLARLANVEIRSEYAEMAQAFEAAGFYGDGIPPYNTWRTAAKLSDAELLASCKIDYAAIADSEIDRY